MKKLYRLKDLYSSCEENDLRIKEVLKIIEKYYPNLPDISEKEYLNLKEKCLQGDKDAQDKMILVSLRYGFKSIIFLYSKYDINYDVEDAINDVYLISHKNIKAYLKAETYKDFGVFVRRSTTNEFKRKMLKYAKKNLDVTNKIYENEEVYADSVELGDENDVVNEVFKKNDYEKGIDGIIKSLRGNEIKVTKMYFGFSSPDPLNLTQIGQKFGVSRERIRQIVNYSFRKLRHPSRSNTLKELDKELE